MVNGKKIMVEREAFDLNGKQCFSYFVRGTVRGRELKAQVTPQDNGGYVLLDIVFDSASEVELVENLIEIPNDKGKTDTIKTYAVRSEDADGTVYECPIKAARKTDKTKLGMILR